MGTGDPRLQTGTDTVVAARDLSRRYGEGATAVDALRGVSLDVTRGQLVAVMGPSGSGKSTLMHLLAGLDTPTTGSVSIAGIELTNLDDGKLTRLRRKHIGFVFQFFNLLPMLNAEENVVLPLSIAGERPDRDWLEELLGKMGLNDRRRHRPSELSGGQQQRVALARALAPKPDILLLDEPLSNLDANLRGDMRFEIRRLHDDFGNTSIYVTHDQVEAMTMADRIVVMNAGRIEQIGTPDEVYDRPRSRFVARFIGGSNVVEARHVGGNDVEVAGHRVTVAHGEFAGAGKDMSFCVKTHDLELSAEGPAGGGNTLPGVVRSQAYLGSHRDYIVDVGQDLLVAAPAALNVPVGSKVHVRFNADRCRGLVQ
jgi:iron(III) transport system ATP-binding protein